MGPYISLKDLQRILDGVQREYEAMKREGKSGHVKKVGMIGSIAISKAKRNVVDYMKNRDSSW